MSDQVTVVEQLSQRVAIDHTNQALLIDGKEVSSTATGGQTVVSTTDVAKTIGKTAGITATLGALVTLLLQNPEIVTPYATWAAQLLPPTLGVPILVAAAALVAGIRVWNANRKGDTVIVSPEEKKKIERAQY